MPHRKKNGITKLIKMLDMMANKNRDHEYLVYQRNKYHNIPLWVIMNTLTFGQISKMFEFLPQNMQGTICQDFGNVKKNEIKISQNISGNIIKNISTYI